MGIQISLQEGAILWFWGCLAHWKGSLCCGVYSKRNHSVFNNGTTWCGLLSIFLITFNPFKTDQLLVFNLPIGLIMHCCHWISYCINCSISRNLVFFLVLVVGWMEFGIVVCCLLPYRMHAVPLALDKMWLHCVWCRNAWWVLVVSL